MSNAGNSASIANAVTDIKAAIKAMNSKLRGVVFLHRGKSNL